MQPRVGILNGGGTDIYAPDDASRPTTTQADRVPHTAYSFASPNVIMGVIGLAVIVLVMHNWRK